jgi:phosphatidylglycerophosphatase A
VRWIDRISLFFAVGFGLGYLPGPTGTYGSLLGLLLFRALSPLAPQSAMLVLALALTLLAIMAANQAAVLFSNKDPRHVVCDEICGQWISLLYVPLTWKALIAGFLLFRFFDIVKPFPARRLEHLRGGWGIVCDDVMAGIYANITLHVLLFYWP